MCNCAERRAELKSALRKGAVLEAAKVAARGTRDMAAHARETIKARAPILTRHLRGVR